MFVTNLFGIRLIDATQFTQVIKPGFEKSKYFSGHGEDPTKGDKRWPELT